MKLARDVLAAIVVMTVLVFTTGVAGKAQKQSSQSGSPGIEFTEIPSYDCGGPNTRGRIAGKVIGAPNDSVLVIYAFACNKVLYVQPTVADPYTKINSDGSFDADIHLGTIYYVLLVKAGFKPEPEITAIPEKRGDILLVARVQGKRK